MPNEATKATYRHVLDFDHAGGSVTLGEPFVAMRDGLSLVRDGVPVDRDLVEMTVRCTDEGQAMIPLAAPMHIQYGALTAHAEAHGIDVDGHLADLAALRTAISDPATPGVTDPMRASTHLYDAAVSGARDTHLPQHVVDAWTEEDTRARPGVDPVIRRIQEETGIDEGEWMRVIDLGTHQNEQIRAMAREMLRPVLGNSAQLEDLRVPHIPKDEVERAGAVGRWIKGAEDVRDIPPFSTKHMPGYVTSPAVLAERDGVTVLVFSDLMASYVYTWQSDPDVAPAIQQEPEERPYPFNLMGPA